MGVEWGSQHGHGPPSHVVGSPTEDGETKRFSVIARICIFLFSFLSFTHLFVIIFYTHHGEVFKTDCLGFCLFTSLPTKLDGSQRSLLDGP